MRKNGLTRFLYGGNAFLYHLPLHEFEDLLGWLSGQDDSLWCIPSVGPSYGRLIDQVAILKKFSFPCVMHLPCGDPRDAAGLERGLSDFVQRTGIPLILYLKEESNFGGDRGAGLDAVARMAKSGVCIGIKYAVVREDPAVDPYLDGLLQRVDRRIVFSGMGERPAIVHLQKFRLPGYTTGSGCIGAAQTQRIFTLCQEKRWNEANVLREQFLPLEDLRDAWGPARVLHAATEAAGIAKLGEVPPFVSDLAPETRSLVPAAVAPLLG
ncbi:dihydrodipicolinate synthase family protein [Bryobacter aggregatus]|uniref:dihydrodipicolinate synthase family protein n=1 Tax=Bryobacter aggregatus TaxID=360054 RepID=UPI000AC41CCC|nr:dihydrodipicolinate synthase family protein [Bryobacter aggregatus]